ncbi:MAG: CHAT domain-containing tetratricopeptide repeat protein [Planctomycetota bacterium]
MLPRVLWCLALLLLAPPHVSQEPPSATAVLREVRLLEAAGRYAEALEVARNGPDLLAMRDRTAHLERVLALSEDEREELFRSEQLRPFLDSFDPEDLAESLRSLDERLEIRRKLLGQADPASANDLRWSAKILGRLGRWPEAEERAQAAIDQGRLHVEANPEELARTLEELGYIRYITGRMESSVELMEEALEVFESIPEELPPTKPLPRAYKILARVLARTARHAEAGAIYRGLLSTLTETRGQHSAEYLVELLGFAWLLMNEGSFANAVTALRRVVELADQTMAAVENEEVELVEEDRATIASVRLTALVNLGAMHLELGEPVAAEPVLRLVLDQAPPRELSRANALGKLVAALRMLGRGPEAIEVAREALRVGEEVAPDDKQFHFQVANQLALLLSDHGKVGEAVELRRVVQGELLTDPNVNPYAPARNLENLAHLLIVQGRLDEAHELIDEALIWERRGYTGEHRNAARMLTVRARIHLHADEIEDAHEYLHEAARIFEVTRLQADGLARSTFAQSPYALLTLTSLMLDEPEEAWEASERGRARALFDMMLAADESAEERMVGEVLSLESVRASMTGDEALVGWVELGLTRKRPEIWAWVVRKEAGVRWHRIGEPGETEIRDELRGFRELLVAPRTVVFGTPDAEACKAAGVRVGELCFGALWEDLAEVSHLVVVSSNLLTGVPVEAMRDSGGRTIGERFSLSYAPSASIHAWLAKGSATADPASAGSKALIVADPPFRERDGEGQATRQGMDSSSLPRLRHSRREAEAVAQHFKDARVLLGPSASEEELAKLANADRLRDFDVIHLATHARVDDVRPERSTLFLSQLELPDPFAGLMEDRQVLDGRLTAGEIVANWRLDADLVALSACETALGRQVSGEGTVGLAHTLLQVGARSLVVSLWQVDDEATSLLMARFYELLLEAEPDDPRPKATALARAQRWLREQRDDEGLARYAHPWFWAGFVLVGAPD